MVPRGSLTFGEPRAAADPSVGRGDGHSIESGRYNYRRISGDRKLSNRLTSASAPNTNKTYGGNLLLRYVLHAIRSRQCGSLHQRRKHGAPRCLRAQRSTVDHRGARPLAPHARPPWQSESVWKHKFFLRVSGKFLFCSRTCSSSAVTASP